MDLVLQDLEKDGKPYLARAVKEATSYIVRVLTEESTSPSGEERMVGTLTRPWMKVIESRTATPLLPSQVRRGALGWQAWRFDIDAQRYRWVTAPLHVQQCLNLEYRSSTVKPGLIHEDSIEPERFQSRIASITSQLDKKLQWHQARDVMWPEVAQQIELGAQQVIRMGQRKATQKIEHLGVGARGHVWMWPPLPSSLTAEELRQHYAKAFVPAQKEVKDELPCTEENICCMDTHVMTTPLLANVHSEVAEPVERRRQRKFHETVCTCKVLPCADTLKHAKIRTPYTL